MKKIYLLLTATLVFSTTFSQQINTQKLDSFFALLNSNNKAMGSVAISKNGKLLYSKAIGFVDSAKTIVSNTQTKYRIGSITKMFTAVVMLQLIEEKKITLETKLSKYFPQIPNANKITIGTMLQHRTGIFNYTNDSTFLNWGSNPITQQAMVQHIAKYSSVFEPNEKYEYSNSNFTLLAYIIEKITKQSFANNIDKRIVKKIGLLNTYFGKKINAKDNEATSFINTENWQQYATETNATVLSGAGGIEATATDLTQFIDALFKQKLINKNSLQQMQTLKDSYGFGMIKLPFYDKFTYGHTGGIDGFNAVVGYFKEDSLSFSCCCNAMNYDFNNIIIGILSNCYNKPFKLPNFAKIDTKDIDFLKLIGTYSTAAFPLKIVITTDGKSLIAQATGQSSFPLEYNGNNTFSFAAAGITLIFDADKEEMKFAQATNKFTFKKEK